ncbi:glutamate synthase small subunit [candidate division KSB3 bacterium]|uniref:Glutamate synthase small subunit n=1 Tax=candidate division KSB3 bacterium TaxID=2044937 RepID=A0A9D5JWJ5_9BACT|nr:glutamate synthase small subunit [candidate division KSB3 bacterium]MBD3325592.1 glutamate synthase small subunit [candidate division KSB3 bacterium]
MGKVLGFLDYNRVDYRKEPVDVRIRHWNEFVEELSNEELKTQGARCMDCGIPFCHWICPVNNIIPEFNDLVYRGCWREAFEWLMKTNNFPEFTGRVCPALCENSCVLGIHEPAVVIRNIEFTIIEHAYREGWMKPEPPPFRTGKRVAIVGSGPAGLACADELNKCGHRVTVYEKQEFLGGLLALGIPDFKLEPKYIERRLQIMRQEGITFQTGVHVGFDISACQLQGEYDALVLCGGAEQPRDLQIEGRHLQGVHFAWEYLSQQNRRNRGVAIPPEQVISAEGKRVIVLGGGDTGADCVGTANRQGARSVKQFELLPQPPSERPADNPWPQWARIQRLSSSHEEGVAQEYGVMTTRLAGEDGQLKTLHAVRLDFGHDDRGEMQTIPGTEFTEEVDLLILAMGFVSPVKDGMLEELGIELDNRGNVKADERRMTSVPGVFAAGDMRRGQSLVVWAVHEGRMAAQGVDHYLQSVAQEAQWDRVLAYEEAIE